MVEIKKSGSYLELDDSGHLIKIAGPEKFQDKWKRLIEEANDFYIRECGDKLHSVYVRGSVAKGAVPTENLVLASTQGLRTTLHLPSDTVEWPLTAENLALRQQLAVLK